MREIHPFFDFFPPNAVLALVADDCLCGGGVEETGLLPISDLRR
jgi:hypothetical protein